MRLQGWVNHGERQCNDNDDDDVDYEEENDNVDDDEEEEEEEEDLVDDRLGGSWKKLIIRKIMQRS